MHRLFSVKNEVGNTVYVGIRFWVALAITARRGTVTVFAAPTGLGVGEAVEQLLEVSLLEEGVNAEPVSPLKTTVFLTVQEFEND